MTRFVVFDLDNTLADSLHLKPLRDQRRWTDVFTRIETVGAFEGVTPLWTELRRRKLHLAVVTHSPGTYARQMLAHLGLAPDIIVSYHDLKGKLKPQPYGYHIGTEGRPPRCGIAVGDEVNDLLAADAFGCTGTFAGWSREPVLSAEACKQAGWGYLAAPVDLISMVDRLSEDG